MSNISMLKVVAALALLLLSPGARAAGLTVFAAASLTDAFRDVGALWQAQGHAPPRFTFESSSTLARQIGAGAPADVFASADEAWMDYLAERRLIQPATRADFVGNNLVIVARAAGLKHVAIKPGFDIAGLLGAAGRLAVGDPAHVPAGLYARQALTRLGVWDSVANRLAPAANVRDALMFVHRGEAPAGIVYGTDARAAPSLGVAGIFPADSHEPIRYPAAATAHAASEARDFVAFLVSPAARDVFTHYGFSLP